MAALDSSQTLESGSVADVEHWDLSYDSPLLDRHELVDRFGVMPAAGENDSLFEFDEVHATGEFTDELDQLHELHELDEFDEVPETDELYEFSGRGDVDEFDGEVDELDQLDELDRPDALGELDELGLSEQAYEEATDELEEIDEIADEDSEAAATGPAVATCSTCSRIVGVARGELSRWHPGGAPLTESQPRAIAIVQQYWREGVGRPFSTADLARAGWQNRHPWSAAFVSWVMHAAGEANRFPSAGAHQQYIRKAIRDRNAGETRALYWAYRPSQIRVGVGDIICTARANSGATYDNITGGTPRATHGDIVVALAPGGVRVIGGNVDQSVTEKFRRTTGDGRLSTDGDQSGYFAVLKCQCNPAERVPARTPDRVSTPTARPQVGGRPTEACYRGAGFEDRVRRVMELLVSRYHYPVNAAAGITGSLIAESCLLPNRVEGSRPDDPMTRVNQTTRQRRTYTPDEIRGGLPQGKGIGLAQWTRGRRPGLFTHVFEGRVLGTEILFNLEAQLDYAVRERRMRNLDGVLRSPTITLAAASDVVLVRYETPGIVLTPKGPDGKRHLRPMTDSDVIKACERRRSRAELALRIYRRTHP